MIRLILVLTFLPLPALAWQAGTDGPLCTLSHTEPDADIFLTYDPRGPVYTVTLTRAAPWPDSPVFALRFEGASGLTISTNRHVLSQEGRALTVVDSGFGNVLRGLSQNASATGVAGEASLTFSLDGAAPEVARFEACATAPTA